MSDGSRSGGPQAANHFMHPMGLGAGAGELGGVTLVPSLNSVSSSELEFESDIDGDTDKKSPVSCMSARDGGVLYTDADGDARADSVGQSIPVGDGIGVCTPEASARYLSRMCGRGNEGTPSSSTSPLSIFSCTRSSACCFVNRMTAPPV
jgi:hypothetical protein